MTQDWHSILLNIGIFAPLAGIPLLALLNSQFAKHIALLCTSVPLLAALALQWAYSSSGDPSALMGENGFAFFQQIDWMVTGSTNIKYMIGVDGISSYMLLLTALIFPVLVIYNWGKNPAQEKLFYGMLFLLQVGLMGFFVSLDLLLFYVFFELVLIPTAFFIGIWGANVAARRPSSFSSTPSQDLFSCSLPCCMWR